MKIYRDRHINCRFKNHDHGGRFGFDFHAIVLVPPGCTVNAFCHIQKREVRVGPFEFQYTRPGVEVVRAVSRGVGNGEDINIRSILLLE